MIHYSDTPQGTEEWLAERSGLITASDFAIAMGKGVTRQKLLHKKRAERRTGVVSQGFKSPAMQHGNDTEPLARAWAAWELNKDIVEVGLATNDALPGLGASLDGLIGDNIGFECKCPMPATHDEYLLKGRLPAIYKWQVYGQMLVCDLEGVWFCSYDPNDTEQLLVYIPRDEKMIDLLKDGLDKFLSDLHEMESK